MKIFNPLITTSEEDNENEDDDKEEDEEGVVDDEDENSAEKKKLTIKKMVTNSILAILNRSNKKKDIDSEDITGDEEGSDEENEAEDVDDDTDEIESSDAEDEDELSGSDLTKMLDMNGDPGSSSGCTAVVTILRDKQLYVANAGDSRCVVSRDGKAIEMSTDHKPEDPIERERIEKAGYKVTLDGRVSGGLNLSRAIGDHGYKRTANLSAEEQAITAYPEIKTLTLEEKDEFMVIACDGIWNFMSSQDVVDFVHNRLSKSSLTQICEDVN
ncbi:unnamed protein product [Didymodactylos carnosus]|uniref:protein-serine/threonine phosphatase n=1 Tax=Didymodactylos carnosus TaxID=1234261 RepID=A0A8S2EZ47_9BILA|nr:unnamed protein product [Didymodactylos carnosus]CAF4164459.1 unnamed protein product [Didymodactylos carnosus]